MVIDSKIEIQNLYDFLDKEGYKFNEFNPFAIRNFDKIREGIYNDSIGLLSEKLIYIVRGTTDPSPFYIETKPMNPKGTAVLLEGLHDRIWMVGIHAGRVTALVNGWRGIHKTKQQKVKRLDKNYKFTPKIYKGWYCCNLHPAFDAKESIGRSSAGCQVIMNRLEFNRYMQYILTSKEYLNNKWTLYSHYIFVQNKVVADIMEVAL